MHSHNPVVATSGVVSHTATPITKKISISKRNASTTQPTREKSVDTETDCVVSGLGLSLQIREVPLNSRKPSTRKSYQAKWKRYNAFLTSRSILLSSLQHILDFLLDLRSAGLSHSSLRVYLSALSANHPLVDGVTVFSHSVVKHFLQGLRNLYPTVRLPPLIWDLPLVLRHGILSNLWPLVNPDYWHGKLPFSLQSLRREECPN